MSNRRAVLHGGPVDQRVIEDVPEETEFIKIPSNSGVKYAHYRRMGDGVDDHGRFWRFDFTNVYDSDQLLVEGS